MVSSYKANKTPSFVSFSGTPMITMKQLRVVTIISHGLTLSNSGSLGMVVKPILPLQSPPLLKISILNGARLMYYNTIFYNDSLRTQPWLLLETIRCAICFVLRLNIYTLMMFNDSLESFILFMI